MLGTNEKILMQNSFIGFAYGMWCLLLSSFRSWNTSSQKYCNILVHSSLWSIYHVTEAALTMESIFCGW